MNSEFFDELGDILTRTAKGLGEKAESIYETQKIRSKISSEERELGKILTDMGKLLYKRYQNGEELDEEIVEFCIRADRQRERISAFREEMAGKRGKKICPSCQKEVDLEVSYCPYCGSACPSVKKQDSGEEAAEAQKAEEESSAEESVQKAGVETPEEESAQKADEESSAEKSAQEAGVETSEEGSAQKADGGSSEEESAQEAGGNL